MPLRGQSRDSSHLREVMANKRYAGCVCEIIDDRLKSFTLHASQEIKPGSVNAYARA